MRKEDLQLIQALLSQIGIRPVVSIGYSNTLRLHLDTIGLTQWNVDGGTIDIDIEELINKLAPRVEQAIRDANHEALIDRHKSK